MAAVETFRHPDQPILVYDIRKSWEQNIEDGPIWIGTYPHPADFPKEKPYKFLGHDLISPITIAAGPASGKKWTDFYFEWQYGMVMEKTRRSVPRESNPMHNVVIIAELEEVTRETLGKTLRGSLDEREFLKYMSGTNSFGNPSPDMSTWAARLVQQREAVREGQLLACSVTATLLDNSACSVILGENPPVAVIIEAASDMLIAGTAATVSGAQVIEFNLACPNVTKRPEEGEMFQNPQLVSYLFAEWKRRFPDVKAGFKAGLYKDKDQMRRVLAAGEDIDYISLINAVAMEVLDNQGNQIVGAGTRAGTFGAIIRRLALEEIEWAADIREKEGLKYEIIGGGGITSVEDVDRYMNTGANVVFSAGYVLHKPELAYNYRLSKT